MDCKHEGQSGKFCNECGEKIRDEGIERLANSVFEKLKPEIEKLVKPSKKDDDKKDNDKKDNDKKDDEYDTELDRMLRRPRKKEKK